MSISSDPTTASPDPTTPTDTSVIDLAPGLYGTTQAVGEADVRLSRFVSGGPNREPTSVESHTTVSKLQESIYQMPQDELLNFQQQLYNAGFYNKNGQMPDPNTIEWGNPDSVLTAASVAFKRAARSGGTMTLGEVIDAGTASNKGTITKTPGTKLAKTIDLTNPADLLSVFQRASLSLLGRAPTAQESAKFVKNYQFEETRAQSATLGARGIDPVTGLPTGQPGTGGSIEGAPTPQTAAEQQIRAESGPEVTQNNLLQLVQGVTQRLGGG